MTAAADIGSIEAYLQHWADPRCAELRDAIRNANQGADQREKAALAFSRHMNAMPISPVPGHTKALLELILGFSDDMIMRTVSLGRSALPAMFFYTDNMAKKELLIPLLDNLVVRLRDEAFPTDHDKLRHFIEERGITGTQITVIGTIGDAVRMILIGETVLVVQGLEQALRLSTQGWDHRQPSEPIAEPVVRGPKEGFVETATVNVVLIRRRLVDERVRIETFTVGTRTGTVVYLVFMAGLALPELVDEVRKRLRRVTIDGILESGMLEEFIEDTAFTPFPLMKATERPDVVAGELLEGKIALIIDGTPHALIAPATFAGGMQAAEDYYQRWPMSTFIRFLRYIFLMMALVGPSVYVALTTFHHEMLPTDLLLSLAASREGVPFPALVEAIAMEISFEALREAGVRLPKPVGQTVSIVGALVIGEAAVRARMVSPVMVIVVALTGIASFVIPNFSTALAIRLLRFPIIILAGTFGFYGIVLGLLAISVHLSNLRSFGVPYMSPTMPPTAPDFKDLMIRVPWWMMRKRPKFMPVPDRKRQPRGQNPRPPASS